MKIVKSLQIAITFERDKDIQYTLGAMLSKNSKEGLFKISDLPTPQDVPPNIPKVSVSSKEFVINISQERFDFFLTIPNHISNEPIKVLAYAKTVSKILNDSFLPLVNYLWCGVVISFNNPYKAIESKMSTLFDRTLKIDRKGKEIASYQLNYGYKEDNYFINYAISEYQSYELKKKVKLGEYINGKDGDLIGMGLNVKMDVNNKQSEPNSNFASDLNKIFELIIPQINKISKNNNLEGIEK